MRIKAPNPTLALSQSFQYSTPSMKTRILLVEDDRSLAEGIEYTLQNRDYYVATASTVQSGREQFHQNSFDLIILDVGLPDGDGFELCRMIRAHSEVPIIFLTARDEEVHVVRGLEIGGDDYISKPFRVNELLARIQAIMRRSLNKTAPAAESPVIIRAGEILLDRERCRVYKNDNELQLTSTEYRLLQTLLINRGNVILRERLLELLWDREERFVDSNTLSVYIRRVREKLEDDPAQPHYIETVRSMGYRWK